MRTSFVLGAPRSGEGKTTISLGLMAAFAKRGRRVQGFKVGPDYLDTTYYKLVSGRIGRNLDVWMMGESACRHLFDKAAAQVDVAIVEGVMGLFDGHRDGRTPSSTADLAKMLGLPVVLVLDASKSAASLAAVAHGFASFDPSIKIAGVILNRWREGRSRQAVEQAFGRVQIPILGFVPSAEEIELRSRHLGLCAADELGGDASGFCDAVARLIENHVDMDALRRIGVNAETAGSSVENHSAHADRVKAGPRVRLGVASDAAFSFYYEDSLDALRNSGVDIVSFSPMTDRVLPKVDGLYFGGGYPENHLGELSSNESMLASIRNAVACGMPVYAECGGLLFLSRGIVDASQKFWPLVGVIPARAEMHGKLQRVGYREARLARECLFGSAGRLVRCHEFHYSTLRYLEQVTPAYVVDDSPEGYAVGSVLASYLHLHFAGCSDFMKSWIDRMIQFRLEQKHE